MTDDQTQYLALIAQYSEETSALVRQSNSLLLVQHEVLIFLAAVVTILGIATVFVLAFRKR